MGKTPKRAAPGGDERNLYVRRLKATTVPSRASESSLPERQRVSENLNRPKLTGIQKKNPAGLEKGFKSKSRMKIGLHQTAKQSKLPILKTPEPQIKNMQPESEDGEVKLNISIQEDTKREDITNVTVDVERIITNKKCTDHDMTKQMSNKFELSTEDIQEIIFTEDKSSQEKENASSEDNSNIAKEVQEQEQEIDIKLTFENEQSPAKEEEAKLDDKRPKDDGKEEEVSVIQNEVKNGINEEIQSELLTDTESYSVGIVESVTSEISEPSEFIPQNDTQKDKDNIDDTVNNDASFVSYNSSIMLKDVEIRLNDCLKDNSKLLDVSGMKDTPNQLLKDLSFGNTLRNISGRRSINRARHITLRENRISPNNSLFVNTSTMSLPQDEECKVLHYTSDLSDNFSTNGSPLERKRKIDAVTWGSAKKQKTETETSLLNTSIGLLKGLRKPIQISTLNVTPYPFASTKLDISGMKNDDNKITAEQTEDGRKWCVIM